MFVDREAELADWERRWAGSDAELLVLWGRRRVGKTELAGRFCADRPHVAYTAAPVREPDNLRGFAAALGMPGVRFESWEAALERVVERSGGERLALVLDEFPVLAGGTPGLTGVFQRWWDSAGRSTRLFVVLCGSAIGFMERELLAERSPLFGRRTGSLRLSPLEPWHVGAFAPATVPAERLALWGILGGIPAYLARLRGGDDWRVTVATEAFSPGGFLFEEVPFLMNTELREPATYLSILVAVAGGATRQTEIADRCRLAAASVNRYLATLIELGLIERRTPFFDPAPEKSRKGLYAVADPFVRFWCTFVLPARDVVAAGHGARHFRERVLPALPTFLGSSFEAACRRHVAVRGGPGGTYAMHVGRHWWKDSTGGLNELDLVAELSDGSYLIGECKATAAPVGAPVIERLRERISRLAPAVRERVRPAVFSQSGFVQGLARSAAARGVQLVPGSVVFR
ncbi:MAG: ATP-binding protein [Deltaproteobacteria bacterium]|nr:ATP-binding protein [Deltaproteobacteria bacterium]